MAIIKKNILLLLLLLFSCALNAQYYDSGQDLWSIKWRKIETQYFTIIFPDYYEPQAQRIAKQMDSLPDAVSFSLPVKKKKIPLLLHTQSVESNGLVVWAPKRIEWWTTSPQTSESQPWFEELGIHEYRHVVQMENITEGVSGILADIFGEHITGALSALLIPKWFLEGDATVTETSLSNSGRGRSADFIMQTKALIEEKGIPAYEQAAFGSYKNFIPDIYHLGYHMVAYGRSKYGIEMWQHTLRNVSQKPWQLNPFERGIKQVSSNNMNGFYRETFRFFDSVWKTDLAAKPTPKAKTYPTPKAKTYTQYLSPFFYNDTCVIALKNSFELPQRFVSIDTSGNETVLRRTGSIYDNYIDYKNNKIIWCETERHSRWEQTVYSVLVEYDLSTRKRKKLSAKTRYFSPSFSADGDKIVLVGDDSLNCNKLLILSASAGEILREYKFGCEKSISYPVFSDDNSTIYYIELTHDGKTISCLDIATGITKPLLQPSYANIAYLKFGEKHLYFTADYNGTRQVYALNLETFSISQLTNARHGVATFNFSKEKNKILYNSYTSDGYRLETSELLFVPVNISGQKTSHYPLADVLSLQEKKKINYNLTTDTFKVAKYSRWSHLFNFHSWAPVSIDPSEQTIGSGVSVMSQNILSTSFLDAGFLWDDQENKGSVYAHYSYRGFYPTLSTSLKYAGRETKSTQGDVIWNELVWSGQARVPYDKNRGSYFYGASASLYYEYKKMFPVQNYNYTITENQTLRFLVNGYWQQRRAYKMLYPRWGQTLTSSISKSFNTGVDAWLLALYGRIFVPAFIPTHSLNIYSGFQYNEQGSIAFSNQVQLARGYTNILPERFFSNKINYALPLFYPDFAVWRIMYVKRIYTNLFYDFMWYNVPQVNHRYDYSIGNELYFDLNAFRLDFGFNIGIRTSYRPAYKDFVFDFLFSLVI